MFFYDGSWECYQGFHLAFFIVSIVVIICFVALPIILLAIIVHRGAGKKYCCFTIEQPVIDAITQGLRYTTIVSLHDIAIFCLCIYFLLLGGNTSSG